MVNERLANHLSKSPDISKAAFVAGNATVIGDVTPVQSSIGYGAVYAETSNLIEIGEGTNIQDLALVHLAKWMN